MVRRMPLIIAAATLSACALAQVPGPPSVRTTDPRAYSTPCIPSAPLQGPSIGPFSPQMCREDQGEATTCTTQCDATPYGSKAVRCRVVECHCGEVARAAGAPEPRRGCLVRDAGTGVPAVIIFGVDFVP